MNLISTSNALTANLKDWPVAKALFPAYSADQLKELTDYIKVQKSVMGLPPVVISKDARIVDGYNRVAAYRQMGLETVSVLVYDYKDDAEMEAHAIDLNAKRRHLDAVTLSKIVLRLAELRRPTKEETKQKLSDAGKKGGKGNKACTLASVQALRRVSSIEKIAKEKGASPQTVRQVKMIMETQDKALISAVESKEISIAKGAELAKVNASSRPGLLNAAKAAAKHPKAYSKGGKKASSKPFSALPALTKGEECAVWLNASRFKLKDHVIDIRADGGLTENEYKSICSLVASFQAAFKPFLSDLAELVKDGKKKKAGAA